MLTPADSEIFCLLFPFSLYGTVVLRIKSRVHARVEEMGYIEVP
jgi:hypothetical protein